MYQGVQSINLGFPPPNVPTHCFYGVGCDTQLQFIYNQSFPDGAKRNASNITTGDGEVVNIPSSEICFKWSSMPND